MVIELPEPLLPSFVDLRDFRFMPLVIEQLRRSKQWLIAKRRPEVGFYSLNLWSASWHELPAGSMEDDDDVLADAAMCSPERWPSVRDDVLRGWIKCSDGRLYHPTVCAEAANAWNAKVRRLAKINRRLEMESGEWEAVRSFVFRRDNFTCSYCGAHGVRLECDHVVALSKGGKSDPSNLVTACLRCNRSKGAKMLSEWRQ